MIDLNAIPESRLAMLDNLKLYNGSHDGTGGPDCKHCARELLYEVVTGYHKDATPPGCSVMIGILPTFNDGPWLNDDHRTEVMRPYLKKMLALDPAKDSERIFYLLDHVYRQDMPTICDAFKEHEAAKKLRGLAKVVDNETAMTANGTLGALRALRALGALDRKQIADAWEKNVVDALDLICSIE